MTIAGAPLASAPEQNSAYAQNKEGRFGKPGRPSLLNVAAIYNRRGSRCGLRDGLAQSLRRLPTDDTEVVPS